MVESTVENKYNLTIKDIRKLKIGDRSKICEPLFWRNNIISAWCITDVAGTYYDEKNGTDNEYWIGIYDEDAKSYAGKFRFYFSAYIMDYVKSNPNDAADLFGIEHYTVRL